jgi:hypothetical protein
VADGVTTDRQRRFRSAPPPSLVADGEFVWGTFDGPVPRVNLLDAWPAGLARRWHGSRLKEWQAFQLFGETHFVLGAVYDAKLLGLVQIVVVDLELGTAQRWERQVPSRSIRVAQGLSGTTSVGRGGPLAITIHNDVPDGRFSVEAHSIADRGAPSLELSITGSCSTDNGDGAHLVVCHPFPAKTPLYSHKCVMAVDATLRLGSQEVRFAPDQSLLILDDHKGHYPSPMRYDWVTGARRQPDGRRVAFNLTDNQVRDPDTFNENALFLDGDVQRLGPIRVTRPDGVHQPWQVRDREGRVEVQFTPTVRNEQHVGPRSVLADYYGPFGWCSGWIEADDAERVSLDGCFGMGEQKLIRV